MSMQGPGYPTPAMQPQGTSGPQGGMPPMQANVPQGPAPSQVPAAQNVDPNAAIDGEILNTNLAKKIKEKDPDQYKKIGREAKRGFEVDEQSRMQWMQATLDWLKLAKQTVEKKTYPWP